jgi:hypothetical protein
MNVFLEYLQSDDCGKKHRMYAFRSQDLDIILDYNTFVETGACKEDMEALHTLIDLAQECTVEEALLAIDRKAKLHLIALKNAVRHIKQQGQTIRHRNAPE